MASFLFFLSGMAFMHAIYLWVYPYEECEACDE